MTNKKRPEGWNERQKMLKAFTENQNKWYSLIVKKETFIEGKTLLLHSHGMVHDKKVYKKDIETIYDLLWNNLKPETCRILTRQGTSIIWNTWHITRIEDLISNLLIGSRETIFNREIQSGLNIKIADVGNSMTNPEIELLNSSMNLKALNEYRIMVGKSTKKILESLEHGDLKRKITPEQIKKITCNGGVVNDPKSIWLLDFWGNNNVFGLLKMPITRHQTLHLLNSFTIKEKSNG